MFSACCALPGLTTVAAWLAHAGAPALWRNLGAVAIAYLAITMTLVAVRGRTHHGGDLGAAAALCILGAGLRDPATITGLAFAVLSQRSICAGRLRALTRPALLAVALAAQAQLAHHLYGSAPDPANAQVAIGLSMLGVSLVTRGIGSLLERTDRLRRRERAVARSGTRLLALSTAEDLVQAGGDALDEVLAATPAQGALLLWDGGHLTFARAVGDGGPIVVAPDLRFPAEQLLAGERWPGTRPPPDLEAALETELGRGAPWRCWPLEARGRLYGCVVVRGNDEDLRDLEEGITAISTQLALALTSSRLLWHDPLTELANRAMFNDVLHRQLERHRQQGSNLAVLFIDLDGFKAVNDGLGHGAGDQLLVEVAQRLRLTVRPQDLPARLGGDEFAVVVDGIVSPNEAHRLAERLLTAVAEPVSMAGHVVGVTASIGVVTALPGVPVDDLMRQADVAMYRAKAAGKGRVEVFIGDGQT
jgi:diguanylate cyclase (GGDEF)-like protein